MSIVWDREQDGTRMGAVSEHFIAMWAEEDGSAHATFCVPPEWQPLADKIEEVLNDWKPNRPIWEWPAVVPEPSNE